MKKIFNKLLLISLIGFIVVTMFCYLSVLFGNFNLFAITEYIISEDPAAAILSPFTILADLGAAIALGIIYFIIPLFALFAVFSFQALARMFQIGKNKKIKDNISNIFTTISKSVLIMLCIYIGIIFIFKFNLFLLLALMSLIFELKLFFKECKIIKEIKMKSK